MNRRLIGSIILAALLFSLQAPAAAQPFYYTVVRGDSLFQLGRHFGVSVGELMRHNGLRSDRILVGQVLSVPRPSAAPSAPVRSNEDVHLLAQMIHAEAAGEPHLGKVAVGAVILNRVRSPLFPNTLRGVLFQPGQFQPVMNGTFWRAPGAASLRAAREALNGWDPSRGALYFYNPARSTNRWIFTRPVILRIGNHVFAR